MLTSLWEWLPMYVFGTKMNMYDVLPPKNNMVPARRFLVRVYDPTVRCWLENRCFGSSVLPNSGDSHGLLGFPAPKTSSSQQLVDDAPII